jgi:hypothetical protein
MRTLKEVVKKAKTISEQKGIDIFVVYEPAFSLEDYHIATNEDIGTFYDENQIVKVIVNGIVQ